MAATLSKRLYKEARATGAVVTGIVNRHAKGWQSARNLTLEVFEGYGFKEKEVLNLSPRNPKLPKYLRDELLTDPGVQGELARHFARAQALRVKTPALKAAYLEYLDAIEQGGWAGAASKEAQHGVLRAHALFLESDCSDRASPGVCRHAGP